MRQYFHIKDGVTLADEIGVECANLNELRTEAIRTSAEMPTGLRGQEFWTGEPWCLWVTDQPKGKGSTVLSLTLSTNGRKTNGDTPSPEVKDGSNDDEPEGPGLVIEVVLPKKDGDDEPDLGTKH